MASKEKMKYFIACSMSAAIVVAAATSLLVSRPAIATAQFAKETGKSCGDCHTS